MTCDSLCREEERRRRLGDEEWQRGGSGDGLVTRRSSGGGWGMRGVTRRRSGGSSGAGVRGRARCWHVRRRRVTVGGRRCGGGFGHHSAPHARGSGYGGTDPARLWAARPQIQRPLPPVWTCKGEDYGQEARRQRPLRR
ncbi:hypothetical protein DAI22_02g105700 [Oryza sativa Japonica Group]|nr:hypothetical protein DAI22_02g105700 [Oryza sativa Japonica Group]